MHVAQYLLCTAQGPGSFPGAENFPSVEEEAMRIAAEYFPDETEEYMSQRQLCFFRARLLAMRSELDPERGRLLSSLKERRMEEPDPLDQCSTMQHLTAELCSSAMRCQTIARIDSALERIDNGEYGFCEITGEEIGLRRLLAMPVATMCLEAQEHHERLETRFRRPLAPAQYC